MKLQKSTLLKASGMFVVGALLCAAIFSVSVQKKFGYSGFILSGYVVEYSDKDKGYLRPFLATEETAGILQRTTDFLETAAWIGPLVRPIPETHIVHVIAVGATQDEAKAQFEKMLLLLKDVYKQKVSTFGRLNENHSEILRHQITVLQKEGLGAPGVDTKMLQEKTRLFAELKSLATHKFDVPYSVLHSEPLGKIFPSSRLMIQVSLAIGLLAAAVTVLLIKRSERD